ncbi:DUF805 domain-containing protein [Yoonia sp. 2307UL14-13]|uniref:DUF805 domain-containing protein n=1 Tax=Yoonia sp. 2307UL14-13 TaxID=3126506 RepID=UPI0030A33F20
MMKSDDTAHPGATAPNRIFTTKPQIVSGAQNQDQPVPGLTRDLKQDPTMAPLDAIKTCLAKSFQFKGRASRSEFWWFALMFIGGGFISFWAIEVFLPLEIGMLQNPALAVMLTFLAITLSPFLAVGMRRFRDAGVSSVLFLVPMIILAIGMSLSFYDTFIANPLREYSGIVGAIIGYVGFLVTAPFVLIACFLKPRHTRPQADPNPNEVPQ